MIKIAFIVDKGFVQSIIENCKKHLVRNLNCQIDSLQWNHDLRKHFPKAADYNFVINFTTHTFFKKEYSLDNLIQIPFISNLRSGISRELYNAIISNDDAFLLNTIKAYAGKQSYQIHAHHYIINHHSYNRSYKFIVGKIPQLILESINRFEETGKTIWQDNHPKSIPINKYKLEIYLKKVKHFFKTRFTYHYWKIGIINSSAAEVIKNKVLLKQVQWIDSNSKKDFCADPFGFISSSGYYIIYEKFNKKSNKGHLEIMDSLSNEIAFKLKADFHFSYPFVLEDNNEIFVIPESHQTNTVDLYKWNEKNKALEFVSTLIENFSGVDTSIIKYNNKYWLFSTNSKNKMADHELNIFYSDQLKGPWIAHRQNPVITSIKSARPAGSFIKIGDKIIRPSQNSGHTYGGSIMLNEIIELNENTYVEKIIDTISSNDLKPSGAIGIHTISNFGNSTLIDGKFTGIKIGKIYF